NRGMATTDPAPRTAQLTEREAEVLRLIARGKINKEIADELGIALTTVITHRRNLMEKLHMRSVAELMLYALHQGYVEHERL
ncbi:MAG: response regulator transcription factor, partial [Alistipes sp.]|nr:response regulator transcription factor [Alistipes sp.]